MTTWIKVLLNPNTINHVDPIVETGLTGCSNGHVPLTVMPIYGT